MTQQITDPIPEPGRFLILGGGAVVSEFYLPAFSQLGWLEHVRVADPSVRVCDALQASFPDLRVAATGFQEALEEAHQHKIDAVIVALPNSLHEHAVRDALNRDLDVLCEKPLALTAAACLRLATQANEIRKHLAVGMTRRFVPAVNAAQRILRHGWLGEIRSIDAEDGHSFAWSSESGSYFRRENGGVLANVGVHVLDLIAYLCGPLAPVAYTDDWRGGAEANAQYELRTASGATVRVKLSYTHQLKNYIRVVGSCGEVQFNHGDAHVTYRAYNAGVHADVSNDRQYRFGVWPTGIIAAFMEELCDFQAAIRHRTRPCATAADAVATAELIDWAYEHHDSSQRSEHVEVVSQAPRLNPGRIVVTGGTGFVGGHLIDALTTAGYSDIVVPVRRYRTGANAGRFPIQFERVDLLDANHVRSMVAGARYVFHLAFGTDGERPSRVTVEGTQNVVDAAIAAGVEAVVVVSTTSVFGDPGGPTEIDENFDQPPPRRPYEQAKAEAERWALARARTASRTRIVVVNPSCVYGPGGRTFTELPARLLQEDAFCWIEEGRGIVNYVQVGNLTDALIRAAAQPSAHGERFIVADGAVTWREFFTELFGESAGSIPSYTSEELSALARSARPTLRDLGRAVIRNADVRRIVREHTHLGRLSAGAAWLLPSTYRRFQNSGRTPPVSATNGHGVSIPPSYLVDLFGPASTRLSSAKARRVLGWTPTVDLASGQRAARHWLTELGLLDGVSST